jgi:hypothetical protein
MNAPPGGMNALQFYESLQADIERRYARLGDSTHYVCLNCGNDVLQTTGYASVHTTLFAGCAGSGKVVTFPLPYCSVCEGLPEKVSTCIHDDTLD